MAKILIIDDDKLFCQGLADSLSSCGNQIDCAHTIEDGKQRAVSEGYDIVFLDVALPDGNGLDHLSEIRSFSSEPEVIILTGGATPDGAELAIESGAWDYIQKPFSISVINLHLMRALQYREERRTRKSARTLKIDAIIGSSPRMKDAYDQLSDATTTDVNVLITGETGTGKELFARAIHDNSRRAGSSLVVVDGAAIQGTLIESTLFGHNKGAFTGAVQGREGLIKQADGGTLFIDEISELPLSLQKVFLRVLQEHRFRPLGSSKEIESNFRLIAATNRDLESMVRSGQFREDLLYRLRAHTIFLPPLRDHPEDIVPITDYHAAKICKRSGLKPKINSPDFIEALHSYGWPGNVRQLVNAIEGAIAAASSASTLFRKHLPREIRIELALNSINEHSSCKRNSNMLTSNTPPTLKELRTSIYRKAEKEYLTNLLTIAEGNIEQACRISDLGKPRLYQLLQKYKIATKV